MHKSKKNRQHNGQKKKYKDYLALNQDNMSERNNMSTCVLLFQRASTINIQISVLVQYKTDTIIISPKISVLFHDIAEKQSLTHPNVEYKILLYEWVSPVLIYFYLYFRFFCYVLHTIYEVTLRHR